MIFVVLGTQKFQCNRLLKEIDRLIEEKVITEDVFAQKGNSDYKPMHYKYIDFLTKEQFEQQMETCDLLITHSGVGTILSAVNHGKPIIVYPRLRKYKEHVDDHQLDIAKAFGKKKIVLMCGENDDLSKVIEQSRNFTFETYESQQENMLQIIRDYLREEILNV